MLAGPDGRMLGEWNRPRVRDVGDEYLPAWEKFGLLGLKCRNDEETIRAYSMANYPAEGDLSLNSSSSVSNSRRINVSYLSLIHI